MYTISYKFIKVHIFPEIKLKLGIFCKSFESGMNIENVQFVIRCENFRYI